MGAAAPRRLVSPAGSHSKLAKKSQPTSGRPVLFHEKYELGMKLGAGAFAQVREANLRGKKGPGEKFAVKIIDLRCQDDDRSPAKIDKNELKLAKNESDVWQTCCFHPNIVSVYETFLDDTFYYIVMEFCVCSVMQRLDEDGEAVRAMGMPRIFREMLVGLGHIHKAGVAHLDVKPDNFLFGGDDEQTVKVADFGLAVAMPQEGVLFGVSGTPPFMSPEMLAGFGYDQKTDVWSLGATAYLMLFGEFPYMPKRRTADAMKALIQRGVPRPRYKPAISGVPMPPDEVVCFIQCLMDRSVEDRCSIEEALSMPFVELDTMSHATSFRSEISTDQLQPVIHHARTLAHEMKEQRADPTVQRGMDDLLRRCQETTGGSAAASFSCLRRSFSDELHDKVPSPSGRSGRARADPNRFGTHNGVTGPIPNFFEGRTNSPRPGLASLPESAALRGDPTLASIGGALAPLGVHLSGPGKMSGIPEGLRGGDSSCSLDSGGFARTISLGEVGILTGEPVLVVSL